MAQSKQTISGQPQVLNNQATIKTTAISSQNIQPTQVGQINKGLNDSQQNPQKVSQQETPKDDKLNSKQPFLELSMQSLIELIQKYKLHYDPFYTRIYGIMHNVEYLKNANGNFEIAYKNLIEYLKKNDRLTRWYEKEIKEFHQQYGIPAILNYRWINFNSGLSVLSIYCCITLYHSDPLNNMTYLREQIQDKILEYINLKQDQQEQQLLKDFLLKLEKRQEVDINSIKVLSLISNLNIMVHQDMIPSQDPKLIAQGEEVFKDDFPKYNILQLFTLDQKLYYQIHVKDEFDKMLLDQYVHYNTKIQHINYEEQAKLVFQNTKQSEQNLFQTKLVQKGWKKVDKLKLLLDQIDVNSHTSSKKWDALEVNFLRKILMITILMRIIKRKNEIIINGQKQLLKSF